MNDPPTLDVWMELFWVLALGATIFVATAAVLQRLVRSAAWQRTIWQVTTGALAVLALVELTGAGRAISQCFSVAVWPWRASRANGDLSGRFGLYVNESGEEPHYQSRVWLDSRLVDPPDRNQPDEITAQTSSTSDASFSNEISLERLDGVDGQDSSALAFDRAEQSPVEQTAAAGMSADSVYSIAGLPTLETALRTTGNAGKDSGRIASWWPGAVWLLGASLIFARAVIARLLLVIFRFRHRTADEVGLADRVRALSARVGLRCRVRVIEATGLSGPIAFGVFRPVIAVPDQLKVQFGSAQYDAMLAHELAHLAAHDPAWLLAADLVTALLWWHPLAWWSRHELHTASESAADEASLVVADGPEVLAACLVELGARLVRSRPIGWLGVAGSGFRSSLGRRVERLLKLNGQSWQPPSRLRRTLANSVGLLVFLAVAILGTAWVRPTLSQKGDSSMKIVHHAWQRSVVAIAVTAAFSPASDRIATANETDPSVQAADFDGIAPALTPMLDDPQKPPDATRSEQATGKQPEKTDPKPASPEDSLPKVEGVILKAGPDKLEISIGSGSGVLKGQKLEVLRVKPLGRVGTIEIIDVAPDTATGTMLPESRQSDPKIGDVVIVGGRVQDLRKVVDTFNQQRLILEQAQIEAKGKLETLDAHRAKVSNSIAAEKDIAAAQFLLAQKELRRAKERLTYSERLASKGYVTQDAVKADEIAAARAELVAKIAEQQVLALGFYQASQKFSAEFQKLVEEHQKRLADDPADNSLQQISTQMDEMKAKMLKSIDGLFQAASAQKEQNKSSATTPSAVPSHVQYSAKKDAASELKPATSSPADPGQTGGTIGPAGQTGASSSPTGAPKGSGSTAAAGGLGGGSPGMPGAQGAGARSRTEPPTQRIRVFPLKQLDPESLGRTIEELMGSRSGQTWSPRSFGASRDGAGGAGMNSEFYGDLASTSGPLYVVSDKRTKSLIVRGTEQQLNRVTALISVLDSSPDKPVPQSKNVRIFQLRFTASESVTELLNRLGLTSRITRNPQSNSVIASGPESELEEIGELIKSLDVEYGSPPDKK